MRPISWGLSANWIQNDLALYTEKNEKQKFIQNAALLEKQGWDSSHLGWGGGGGSAYIEDALTGCFPAFKRIQYHLHQRWLMSLFRKDEGSHMPALFMTDEYSKITWRMKGHFKNPINRISLQIKWLKWLRTCNNFFDLYLPSCW